MTRSTETLISTETLVTGNEGTGLPDIKPEGTGLPDIKNPGQQAGISTRFRSLVAPITIGLAMMATPAFAGENAANSNVPVANASISSTAPKAMAEPHFVNASTWTENDASLAAAAASVDKVAIVVWGGSKQLQYEAFLAAQDLVNAGVPTAFVLAPDHNSTPNDAVFQVYAKSAPQGEDSHIGVNHTDLVRSAMYEHAKYAYQTNFPQRVASLDIK